MQRGFEHRSQALQGVRIQHLRAVAQGLNGLCVAQLECDDKPFHVACLHVHGVVELIGANERAFTRVQKVGAVADASRTGFAEPRYGLKPGGELLVTPPGLSSPVWARLKKRMLSGVSSCSRRFPEKRLAGGWSFLKLR